MEIWVMGEYFTASENDKYENIADSVDDLSQTMVCIWINEEGPLKAIEHHK